MEEPVAALSPEDSPSARAALRGQLSHLKTVEAGVQRFAANAAELAATNTATLDMSTLGNLLSPAELAQLGVDHTFVQLQDFAQNMQHQLTRQVVAPLEAYRAELGAAIRAAKAFDEESEGLDAAHAKYLSLSRDAPVETRAHAHGELCDRAAGVALSLFDARSMLREGCAAQRSVPQRALTELLVAQLAYHQSCTRLLTSIMPQVSESLARTDAAKLAADERKEADRHARAAMPRPQLREGLTLAEGWLYKGTFNMGGEHGQGQLSRLAKPWNKRWFVLCDDGKLYYYKAPEDARQAKVPIDMSLLSSVSAVNGPLEFELQVGKRTLRLKAAETAERSRWMSALQAYLDAHAAEREAALALTQRERQSHTHEARAHEPPCRQCASHR